MLSEWNGGLEIDLVHGKDVEVRRWRQQKAAQLREDK